MAEPNTPGAAGAASPSPEPEPRRFRPREQFWPYASLEEEPSDEELASLDPDLQDALYDRPISRPFSFTIVFSPPDGSDGERAVALAQASHEYQTSTAGGHVRHRARFLPSQAGAVRDLWQLVGAHPGTEVLLDDKPVPYARNLWLALLWHLVPG